MSSSPWLDRFIKPVTISQNAAFRVVAVNDLTDGARRAVVVADARTDRALATRALTCFHAAHAEPPHPAIARSLGVQHHEDLPFVTLDFPAKIDLDQLLQIGTAGYRSPYAAADGFSISLRDAIMASSRRLDDSGQPMCIGPLALANVLFSADGSWTMIGFGHNVVVHDEHQRIVVRNRFYQAPEIALGARPTSDSDVIGLIEMTRSMMTFVAIGPALGRVILGTTLAEDVELFRLVHWFEGHVMRGPAASRPSIEQIIATSNRIRAIIGCVPDEAAFKVFVNRMLKAERPDFFEPGQLLRVGPDGSWFQRDGAERVDLERSQLQRRLLWRLVQARFSAAGRSLDTDALVEALWPGERIIRESAMNRLYVAINNLRRAGLGDLLERVPTGYRLRPDVHLETPPE